MVAQLIDGKAVAEEIKADLEARVRKLTSAGHPVHLKAVQVGENPASRAYIRSQQRSCEEVGITYSLDELPADTTQEQLDDHLGKLNADLEVTGIILQMPVPEGVDARQAQWAIAPGKDVEGILPEHVGMVSYGAWDVGPCTAMGAFELITRLPLEPKKEIHQMPDHLSNLFYSFHLYPSYIFQNFHFCLMRKLLFFHLETKMEIYPWQDYLLTLFGYFHLHP